MTVELPTETPYQRHCRVWGMQPGDLWRVTPTIQLMGHVLEGHIVMVVHCTATLCALCAAYQTYTTMLFVWSVCFREHLTGLLCIRATPAGLNYSNRRLPMNLDLEEKYRNLAIEFYDNDDDVRIEPDAAVEVVSDGAWVDARVWVSEFDESEDAETVDAIG